MFNKVKYIREIKESKALLDIMGDHALKINQLLEKKIVSEAETYLLMELSGSYERIKHVVETVPYQIQGEVFEISPANTQGEFGYMVVQAVRVGGAISTQPHQLSRAVAKRFSLGGSGLAVRHGGVTYFYAPYIDAGNSIRCAVMGISGVDYDVMEIRSFHDLVKNPKLAGTNFWYSNDREDFIAMMPEEMAVAQTPEEGDNFFGYATKLDGLDQHTYFHSGKVKDNPTVEDILDVMFYPHLERHKFISGNFQHAVRDPGRYTESMEVDNAEEKKPAEPAE